MTWLGGKSVVVTGAGRGIGAAYARAAADEGARVVVNDIDAEVAEQVAADIRGRGGTAIVKVADVSQWSEAADLIGCCVSEFGTIDGLINNAGLFDMSMPGEITESQLTRLLAVNVAGVVACSMPAIRHMRGRGSGSIVNVTSGAHMGIAHMAAYAATKGAVASLTYTWSMELAAACVRVNAISPLASTRMGETTAAFLEANGLGRINAGGSPGARGQCPGRGVPAVGRLGADHRADRADRRDLTSPSSPTPWCSNRCSARTACGPRPVWHGRSKSGSDGFSSRSAWDRC